VRTNSDWRDSSSSGEQAMAERSIFVSLSSAFYSISKRIQEHMQNWIREKDV
jgi:hypothetical protein